MRIYRSKTGRTMTAKFAQRGADGIKKKPNRDTLHLNRLIRETGLQPKLKIGQPNDRYEQEADRVADRVMAAPDAAGVAAPVAGGITPLTAQRTEEEETAQPKILQRQEEEEEAQP